MNKKDTTKKIFIEGKVVSKSTPNTVIVSVVHEHRHPLYKKAVKRMKRFAVHNTGIEVTLGDRVRFISSRPLSKTKHHILVSKIG